MGDTVVVFYLKDIPSIIVRIHSQEPGLAWHCEYDFQGALLAGTDQNAFALDRPTINHSTEELKKCTDYSMQR